MLFIDYNTIVSTLNEENLYFNKTLEIDNIDTIFNKDKKLFLNQLCLYCLNKNQLNLLYKYNYLNYINYISGPNIHPDNCNFIKKEMLIKLYYYILRGIW